MVKNHSFADGNKRSGAYLFIDFLHLNGSQPDAQGNPQIKPASNDAIND